MLHVNSLVKFVTLCNENQQRPMFQGMAQRILLIRVRNLCLEGHQYQWLVCSVQFSGWDGRGLKARTPETTQRCLSGETCILLVPYSALSAVLSFLQHSVQILSTA